MKTQWNACAYANDGNVYAIDMAGDCYKVNPATGDTLKLGPTGFVPKYISAAAVDKTQAVCSGLSAPKMKRLISAK